MRSLRLITLIRLGKVVKKLKKGRRFKEIKGVFCLLLLHVLMRGGSLFKKLVLIKEKNRATSV